MSIASLVFMISLQLTLLCFLLHYSSEL